MNDIKIVKLSTQEDIICKHEYHDTTGTHVLKSPCVIVVTPNGFGAMPYTPYAEGWEEGISISEEFVMTVLDPSDEMKNQYNTSFGNGLIAPTKQKPVATGPIGIVGAD
jgi:hypothetical protein